MTWLVDRGGVGPLIFFFALFAACTKPNPNRCCTDQADCDAAGIPLGTDCPDGKVCRANVCLKETCTSSADCDALAPYCSMSTGACSETCVEDTQCPGAADDPMW